MYFDLFGALPILAKAAKVVAESPSSFIVGVRIFTSCSSLATLGENG